MILLKKKFGDTIYQKIFSLILLSSLFFFALFFAIYHYTARQEKEVYTKTLKEFNNEINSLIELNDNTNVSNIIDMVYWDDFKDYLITRNQSWFDQNIVMSLETYAADYLGIYDIYGKFISKYSNDKLLSKDIIPPAVFKLLNKKRQLKFYLELPEGVAEIYAASIHPSNDINAKQTPASGYFFIVRLCDKAYFQGLERLNNSAISFVPPVHKDSATHIRAERDLLDYKRHTIRKIYFERPLTVSFQTTKNILYLLIFTYLINVVIYLLYSRKWVYKPLKLITNILESVNEKDMLSLKNVPGEFKYISYLFKENNDQRKLLEIAKAKAEESDRLKSSFLTNISHEIRTPINAIFGFSDLLLNFDSTPEERAEYSKIIHRSGSNLVSIIDDLIEMSKIDTNQVVPNYGSVNLDLCLEELYKTIKITIPEEKNIEFTLQLPESRLHKAILTDEIKLRQILTNLVTNAIKYTESGFVIFGYDFTEKGELEFFVKDSGIGIKPDQHALIFDRFHRVDSDFTIKVGGLGLGLSISKAYVLMMEGRIDLESNDSGTTFRVTFPPVYDTVSCRNAKAPKAIDDEPLKSLTILVAEDNNINFLLMQKILHLNKHTILRARDGQEAIDICRDNEEIDLVLMDIKMPVLGGYEAFAVIREFRPELPVIAQTAYSSSEDEEQIMQAGFTGYISKPINKEKLVELMDNVMELKYSA